MDILKIIKELTVFFGNKLDAIANKKSIGVEIKGAELITIKGEKGEKGDPGQNIPVPGPAGAPGKDGKNGIGVDGRDGRDGKDGVNGVPGRAGKDGSPDTGEQIVEKINKDKSSKKVRKEKVEGLLELEDRVKTNETTTRGWGGGGSFVYAQDISASLDGVTKTFTLVQNARVVMVFCSSFPNVLRPTIDYTTTSSAITFTSEITASSTLGISQTVMILYKIL